MAFILGKWRVLAGLALVLALAVGIYALAGFVLVPYLVQSLLWPMLSEQQGGLFQAEKTTFDPFSWSATVEGFSLKSAEGHDVLALAEASVDVDVRASLANAALVFSSRITRPSVNILFDKQGKPNFGFLIPPEDRKQDEKPGNAFPFLLTELDIGQGRVTFEDQFRGKGFKSVFSPLDASLTNFGPAATGTAHYTLKTLGENQELLSAEGDLQMVKGMEGELKLQGLSLAPLADWLGSDLPYTVGGGSLSLTLKYHYAPELGFEIPDIEAQIKQFSLAMDGKPFLDAAKITAEGLSFEPKTNQFELKSASVEKFAMKGPTPLAADAVKLAGLVFGSKTNQFELKSANVEKFAMQGPTPIEAASVKSEGLAFQVKTNQFELKSANVEKFAMKGPAPIEVSAATTQGLVFEAKSNQIKLQTLALEKLALKGPMPATAESAKGEGLVFQAKEKQLGLQSLTAVKLKVDQGEQALAEIGGVSAKAFAYGLDNGRLGLELLTVDAVDLKTPSPLRDKQGNPRQYRVESLTVGGVAMDVVKKRLAVEGVLSSQAVLGAWLEQDGSLGLGGVPKSTAAPAESRGGAKQAAWHVIVKRVELNDNHIALSDFRYDPPVRMRLDPLNLLVKEFDSAAPKPFWLGLNTGLSMNGRVALEGQIKLVPLTANLKLYVDDLSLPGFQAYLDRAVGFRVVKGKLNANADIDFDDGAENKLRVAGDVAVANFNSVDKREGRDFLNWKNLRLNSLIFENTPQQRLSIKEVIATQPYVLAFLGPDKKFNIAENFTPPAVVKPAPPPPQTQDLPKLKPIKLAKPEKPEKKELAAPATARAAMPRSAEDAATVLIGTLRIHDGNMDFADMTIKPTPFAVSIHELNGDIRSLSSRQDAKSDVLLEGKLNQGSTVRISGKVNPFSFQAFTDIVMKFNDVNLTTLSPYSAKFAGYRIEKGKISMDLRYKLDNGQLTAENKFVLDHLELGEQVESPDATTLPVRLAVSLLKDGDGKIDINLPVSGDLSNPTISLRGLLAGAATELLTKIIASPLTLLGNLVGGGSNEKLDAVAFAPGAATLSDNEKDKLTSVAKALKDRPSLNLDIKGMALQDLDGPILAEIDLTRQLKNAKLIELGRKRGKKAEWDELTLAEEDYNRLFTNLYRWKKPDSPELQDLQPSAVLSGSQLEQAKRKLLGQWTVSEVDLRGLARARGETIRSYLVKDLGLPDQRIYLLDVKLGKQDEKEIKAMLSLSGS